MIPKSVCQQWLADIPSDLSRKARQSAATYTTSRGTILDFSDHEVARILAHAMSLIPPDDRADTYKLIARVAGDTTPKAGSTAEMYGALGRQRLDPPGMLEKVVEQARLANPFDPYQPPQAIAAGSLILVGYEPWITALAFYGQSRPLTDEQVQILKAQVTNSALTEQIVRALVVQDRPSADLANKIDSWGQEISIWPRNSYQRAVLTDTLSRRLALMPRAQLLEALPVLRSVRSQSTEPEVRIALGKIIIDSQYDRVKTNEFAASLLD